MGMANEAPISAPAHPLSPALSWPALPCSQVFSNCRKFNEPAAPIVGQAAAVEAAWKKYWQGAGIYAEGGPGPASARARPEGGSKHGPFDWKGAARAVSLLSGCGCGWLAARAAKH